MAEYFSGYGDTRPRPRVCSSRSSMAGYFTGTDTSIYSSKLVILWTACVERPGKFPGKYPSMFEISRMEGFKRGRLSGTSFPVPVEILGHETELLKGVQETGEW